MSKSEHCNRWGNHNKEINRFLNEMSDRSFAQRSVSPGVDMSVIRRCRPIYRDKSAFTAHNRSVRFVGEDRSVV